MALPFSPHRPHHDKAALRRRRLALLSMLNNRAAQDMVSLLASTVAGALATGALATLIMMSAPAHARPADTDGTESAAHKTVAIDRLHPARAVPGDDPTPIPFSAPRDLELPQVCTCVLPRTTPN